MECFSRWARYYLLKKDYNEQQQEFNLYTRIVLKKNTETCPNRWNMYILFYEQCVKGIPKWGKKAYLEMIDSKMVTLDSLFCGRTKCLLFKESMQRTIKNMTPNKVLNWHTCSPMELIIFSLQRDFLEDFKKPATNTCKEVSIFKSKYKDWNRLNDWTSLYSSSILQV